MSLLQVLLLSSISSAGLYANDNDVDSLSSDKSASFWQDLNPFKKNLQPSVQIIEAYIDIRTGPGQGFPVFYTASRGDWINVIKRRTDWYKVRIADGTQGWVHLDQLEKTLEPKGAPVVIDDGSLQSFNSRSWEAGIFSGELEGAPLLSVYGSWLFTHNLGLEFSATDAIGDFSDSVLVSAGLVHQAFPHWRNSPFFTLGAGNINVKPSTSLVRPEDRQDDTVYVGAGLKVYLHRSFMLRLDYRNYVILTSREQNEEIEEWKVGFAVFW